MGYTHYVTVKKNVPTAEWAKVINAKNQILNFNQNFGSAPIQDESEGDLINLNGIAPDDFETFYINPNIKGFNFCKTGRRPYDIVVVAILCAINNICGDCFDITSDGDRKDWINGFLLCRDACDFGFIPESIKQEN